MKTSMLRIRNRCSPRSGRVGNPTATRRSSNRCRPYRLDPSTTKLGRGSKIAIDATRQWPEEGGPPHRPEMNRALLENGAPDAFDRVDDEWGELIKSWRAG